MATANNVNLLLNTQSNSAKANHASSLRSTYFSRKTYNVNRNVSSSFNNVLDRVSSAPQQTAPTRDTYKTSNVESTAKSSSNDVRTFKSKTQDTSPAPKDTAPEDIDPKEVKPVEDIEDEGTPSKATAQMPIDMSALFSTSTESLLAVKEAPVTDEPVLMSVLPQESNSNNQSMLNMLAGNNWRQLQPVQSLEQPAVIEPEQVMPTVDELLVKPLVDVEVQTTVAEPQMQARVLEPNAELVSVEANQLPTETVEPELITVRDNAAVEKPTIEQPTLNQLPINEEAAPVQPQIQSDAMPLQNQSARNVPVENLNPIEPQVLAANVDTTAQTEVISNDANLSNVIDAAKNSQPKVVTSDIQAPLEQQQRVEAETEMPLQPTAELSSTSTVERQGSARIDQPLTSLNPLERMEQPAPVEPLQPVQTQQSIGSQTAQTVETPTQVAVEVPVVQNNQPLNPQFNLQQNVAAPVVEQSIGQPTLTQTETAPLVEQPTTGVQTEAVPTTEQPVIEQPLVGQPNQSDVAQLNQLPTPTETQQLFDENNAAPAPRGTEDLAQPTDQPEDQTVNVELEQKAATGGLNADVEPVHRRFHGHANQQEAAAINQARQSAWSNRSATTYQATPTQQRSTSQANNSTSANGNQAPLTQAAIGATADAAAQGNVGAQTNVEAQINVGNQNPNNPGVTVQPLNAPNETPERNAAAQPLNTPLDNVSVQNSIADVDVAPNQTANTQPLTQNISAAPNRTQPLNIPTDNVSVQIPNVDAVPNQTVSTQPLGVPTQNISSVPNRNATAPVQSLNTPLDNVSDQTPIANVETNQATNTQPLTQNVSAAPNRNAAAQPLNTPLDNVVAQNPIANVETNRTANFTTDNIPAQNPIANVETNRTATAQTFNVQRNNVEAQSPLTTAQSFNVPLENVAAQNPTEIVRPLNAQINNVETQSRTTAAQPVGTPTATQTPSVNVETATTNQPSNVQRNNVETQSPLTTAQPVGVAAQNIPAQNPTTRVQNDIPVQNDAAQLQGSVAQNNQSINRPVNNIPQSFSIFGNELDVNNPVTAPQQPAAFDQQSNQQSNQQPNQQPNQQFNQQTNQQQQAQQQAQQQIQQRVQAQQAINVQAQAQTQAQTAPGQTTVAQMPSESFAQNLGAAINNLNMPQPSQNAQPSTPNTAFAQQLRDDFNVTGQIVENARMFRNALTNSTEMVLQLKPEHLGELTLRVSVTAEGTVNASFHSDNAAVRAIIENSLVSLKQELANQGLKVDNVEVYSGLGDGSSLMNGKGRQGWQQNNRRNAQRVERVRGGRSAEGNGGAQSTSGAQAVESAQAVENVISETGVDYKV